MSKEGLRVIAVATQKPQTDAEIPSAITECSLTLLGLIGLADPPRESVKSDIAVCNKAGIRVVMITGDNSFDTVVSTFSLCSVDDLKQVCEEVDRVLKPGGVFLFLEHGSANSRLFKKVQHLFNPLYNKYAYGCHITRTYQDQIRNSGLNIVNLKITHAPIYPRLLAGYMYEGIAEKPPQVPDIGNSIFSFNYEFGPSYIAWYKSFLRLGLAQEETIQNLWVMNEKMVTTIPRPFLKMTGKTYLNGFRKKAATHVALQEKETLLPGICRMDYLFSNLMGNGFVRSKTLGDGDNCCNCHYDLVGECEWSPEKGFINRK